MCGIAGTISVGDDIDDLTMLVTRIVKAQNARGPDAQAVEPFQAADARIVLGHNRLSIVDLSSHANQPFSDESGNLTIVFNGEIYNFVELRAELEAQGVRFRTTSDTEVLLQAYARWGAASFERLFGMFAFAILDKRNNRVILVRDRFGVKPLYYLTNPRRLVFASTGDVIARWAGLKPNLEYVRRGLDYKYYEDESDISAYEGLKSLRPGHWLEVELGNSLKVREHQYYNLADRVEAEIRRISGMAENELEQELRNLLDNATQIRLRTDVPVGVSLSGGVDSSVIAATAKQTVPQLTGYSFSHPSDRESEGPLVEAVVNHARIEPRYVWPQGDQEIVDLFWRCYDAQRAPFPHASMMAQFAVFEAAHKDGLKVLLGGQGGDEAFMGYRKFYMFYAQSVLRQRRLGEAANLLSALPSFALAVAGRAHIFWAERKRYAGQGMGSRLVLPELTHTAGAGMAAGQTPRDRQIQDITRFSLPSLLRYEDRNSLGNSVESRLPFMDHRIIEFGLALPERLKLSRGFGKWILRKAAKGRAPASVLLNRDKRGFDVNQNRWIDAGLGAALREGLRERRAGISEFLPQGAKTDDLFDDAALKTNPQAFKEAVSLIWLGDQA